MNDVAAQCHSVTSTYALHSLNALNFINWKRKFKENIN